MSFDNKSKAVQAAERTRKKMANPTVWSVHVWENLGWHACLQCAMLTLYIDKNRNNGHLTYSCLLSNSPENKHSGESYWTDCSVRHRNPQKAVDAQLERAGEFISSTLRNWTELRRSLALPLAKGGSMKR